MYSAQIHKTVEAPWTDMEPIRVGPVPSGAGTPGVYMTVELNARPFARIDAWPLHGGPYTGFTSWKRFVVLGWNDHVHIVDPLTREVRSIECDGYFGGLFPTDHRLLIADASKLVCLNELGEIVWKSDTLGIDGVTVAKLRDDGVIEGSGEWDPPGGWRPFHLSIETGQSVVGTHT